MRVIILILRCVGAVTALTLPNLNPLNSIHHGAADQFCCFALTAQILTETDFQTDPQTLGHARPSERYCLNLETFQFLDGDQDVFRAADRRTSEHQDAIYCPTAAKSFTSHQATVDLFTMAGKQYLALDGNTDFTVAPDPASASCTLLVAAEPLTKSSPPTTDGVPIRLLLIDQTPSCGHLSKPSVGVIAAAPHEHMSVKQLGNRDVAASSDSDPTITCSTSGASPSLAPSKVFVGGSDAQVLLQSMNMAAAISPTQSSAFQFEVPNSWSGNARSKCAVYFRLPYCSELPSGFPCYNFSGMEQEYVSNSGMIFYQVQSQPYLMNWRANSLVQVTPGQDTLVGTFDCSAGGDPTSDGRMLSWLVRSQNRFLLQYMQPDEDRHVDNMGLWVVACDS